MSWDSAIRVTRRIEPHGIAPRAAYSRVTHAVALLTAAVTVPLLFSGGQVTTYRVGMAVPDWPTTFGQNMFLYDMWHTSWGVFIEHRHRLFGTALGIASLVLALRLLVCDHRGMLKVLGLVALGAVIAQGLFGRNRVLLNSTNWAAVHACTGQVVFSLLVALSVLTGRDWIVTADRAMDVDHLRRRAMLTLILVYAQIVVGAILRHYGQALIAHAVLAVAVWGHAATLAWRVERNRSGLPWLVLPARLMAATVTSQVILGIAAWWMLRPFDGTARRVTDLQAFVRTWHVVNGALLLAATVSITLQAYRHLVATSPSSVTSTAPITGGTEREAFA